MKTNNYYLRIISEKLNNKEYLKHWTDNYYLKEILSSYGVSYDKVYANVKYLFDWCKELTGDSSLKTGNSGLFYLKTIARFLDSEVSLNKSVNYYLRVISELIDSKESSSVSLSVSSLSPYVSDVVTLSGVLVPFGGVVKLYDGDSLLDTLETSSSDGSFSKSWTATIGTHSFRAVFEETDDYRGSESETVVVNVVKKVTSLSLSAVDSSLFVDDDLVLEGSLLWHGNAVVGASVKLYQDDVLLDTLSTGNDGSFTKTVPGLSAGDYVYNVVYDGTNVYESSQSQDVNVEVSKYATSLSLNVPMSLVYSDSFNLSGVLTDENNNVLKNMSVKLLVDNVEKATTTTDSTGTASFTQTPVRTGNHDFQLTYAGNYKYESTDSSVVSRVVDKETSVLSLSAPLDNSSHYVNDDINVVGSLLEDDGVVMKSKSIVVGDKGTVTTGNDGTFSKTISYDVKGTKTLTVSYAGDENYTGSSVTRTLTLLRKTPVITIGGSESEIYTNETVTISGTLKYNNNPVKNHSIHIYDGSTLLDTVTTNASGEYSKTVSGLTKGIHTLKAVSVETNEYESVTSSNVSVEVFNVITGISIESNKSIISNYHSENATLTAKLIDSDGETVEKDGLTITFKKNDVSLGTATTSDGIATKTVTANDDGEITCKAEYSSFNDTVEIEDIYYYTDGKTDLNEWTIGSGITQTYTENGICLFSDSTKAQFAKLNITYPSPAYTVEYKITGITRDTPVSNATPTFMVNGVVTDDTKSGSSNKIRLFQIPVDVVDSYDGMYSVGDTLRFVYDGANVTLLHNNSVVDHKSATSSYPGAQLRLYFSRGACISDIKVDGLDISSIGLASDKSILSYADSDSCTLTATVENAQGVQASSGIPVSFYKGATLLGTAYTNNNGVATYSYTSTGAGDIVLSAKAGNNITSNNITIEDITKYIPTEKLYESGTSTEYLKEFLYGNDLIIQSENYIIEFEGKVNNVSGIALSPTDEANFRYCYTLGCNSSSSTVITYRPTSPTANTSTASNVPLEADTYTPMKFIYTNGYVDIYVNNTLVISYRNDTSAGLMTGHDTTIAFKTWNKNAIVGVKNLKVRYL